jgi:hypothetical protein
MCMAQRQKCNDRPRLNRSFPKGPDSNSSIFAEESGHECVYVHTTLSYIANLVAGPRADTLSSIKWDGGNYTNDLGANFYPSHARFDRCQKCEAMRRAAYHADKVGLAFRFAMDSQLI